MVVRVYNGGGGVREIVFLGKGGGLAVVVKRGLKHTHPSSRFLSPLGELTAKMQTSLRAVHRSQLSPSASGRHLSFRLLHSLLIHVPHVSKQGSSTPRNERNRGAIPRAGARNGSACATYHASDVYLPRFMRGADSAVSVGAVRFGCGAEASASSKTGLCAGDSSLAMLRGVLSPLSHDSPKKKNNRCLS